MQVVPLIMILRFGLADNANTNMITVLADENSWNTAASDITGNHTDALIVGFDLRLSSDAIVLDQGIESNAIGDGQYVTLDADLVETQYIIEIDNRLGYIADFEGNAATPSFIDDDSIASYYFSQSTNAEYFGTVGSTVIAGPRGTRLLFLVGPSTDLASSTYLFNQLGGDGTIDSVNVKQIDTTVRITGATTGYRVDLPIRIVKKNA
jgi:hypothetical protein